MTDIGVVLLYALGVALVVTELFIPGAVIGLIGLLCVGASIFLAFWQGLYAVGWGLVTLTVVAIPFLAVLWVKVLSRVMAMRHTQKDTTSAQVYLKELVGQEGVALTQLRPSGMARFGDRKVDVVSEGEVIERDVRVTVVEVKSNRVVVRPTRR